MWESRESGPELVTGKVDDMEVAEIGRGGERQACDQGQQERRPPGSRRADDQDIAVLPQVDLVGNLPLALGLIQQGQRSAGSIPRRLLQRLASSRRPTSANGAGRRSPRESEQLGEARAMGWAASADPS